MGRIYLRNLSQLSGITHSGANIDILVAKRARVLFGLPPFVRGL